MTSKRLAYIWITFMAAICLVGCSSNKIAKIEDSNAFIWQKYMNEEEFEEARRGNVIYGSGRNCTWWRGTTR